MDNKCDRLYWGKHTYTWYDKKCSRILYMYIYIYNNCACFHMLLFNCLLNCYEMPSTCKYRYIWIQILSVVIEPSNTCISIFSKMGVGN